MRIILVASGSGGHIFPALQLADSLKNEHEVCFYGGKKYMEARIIPENSYPFVGLDTLGFDGSFFQRINALLLLWDSYRQVKNDFKKQRPDVVIGFGNYVTIPVILAAKKLKIKTMIHEQNSIIGLANRFLAKKVDARICSFPETLQKLPKAESYCLGNPRAAAFKDSKVNREILKKYDLQPDKPTVLFFMGSQGSLSINDFMLETLKEMRKKDYQVLYITGRRFYEEFSSRFNESETVKFRDFADMRELLPNIDLLVSRAGATTITEICASGIASILIPSPYVPNDHQRHNAETLVKAQATILVSENELQTDSFVSLVTDLLADKARLQALAAKAKELANLKACDDFIALIKKVTNNGN